MKTHHETIERMPLSVSGMKDLAYSLLHPGNAVKSDFRELAEFIARAPHFTADVPAEAVTIARTRLTEARDRGNQLAARLLAELDRSAA